MTSSDVTLVKDIITGLATFVAMCIAIFGYRDWKRQLHWKTEYELAQKLLRATYKVKEALADVTSFRVRILSDEEERVEKEFGIDSTHLELIDRRAAIQLGIYGLRWQKVQETLVELDALSLEAETIWGQAFLDSFTHFRKCIHILTYTLSEYLNTSLDGPYSDKEKNEGVRHVM